MKKTAKSLKEIIDYIEVFNQKTRKGTWYRGIVNCKYDLIPSLQRSLPRQTYHNQIQVMERKMFNIFKEVVGLRIAMKNGWKLKKFIS
ncbi:hypothetical protein ACQKOM_10550 [Peribacillus frigoritolerans]|uniref:hypothetical protein n=1 Tax=Peribacillus frigoritolerans TaxID=450367 RepID=UPI003D01D227